MEQTRSSLRTRLSNSQKFQMADCFSVHMHSDDINNYLSSDGRNFLYDGVMQFQRLRSFFYEKWETVMKAFLSAQDFLTFFEINIRIETM